MNQPITIAIAEDVKELRENLELIVDLIGDIKCLFAAKNGAEVMPMIEQYGEPDVILMDIEMPIQNGIETTRLVKKSHPNIKVLILTVFDNNENVFNALKNGADGYMLKGERPQEVLSAIQQVNEGRMAMSPEIAMKTLQYFRKLEKTDNESTSDYHLTNREVEILEFLCTGLSYKQIAGECQISERTVGTHIENIYKKLNVNSAIEASNIAKRNDWF